MRIRLLAIAGLAALALGAFAVLSADAATKHSLELRRTSLGKIVVDAKGRTLYLFEKDKTRTKSTCYRSCAAAWPPALVSGKATVGTGLKKSMVGRLRRNDGKLQLTYGGHPLYRFAPDNNKPGSVKGQGIDGFGAEWYVVGANGKAVEKHAS